MEPFYLALMLFDKIKLIVIICQALLPSIVYLRILILDAVPETREIY